MYECEICSRGWEAGKPFSEYLRVRVPELSKSELLKAQKLALHWGFDPYRPGRMTDQGGGIKYYIFTQAGIKTLFNGKAYYKMYSAYDTNGNKVAKVFYMDGTEEIVKDARLPLTSDKVYKSISGLRRSK